MALTLMVYILAKCKLHQAKPDDALPTQAAYR
jgi:hypothetical protein